MTYRIPSKGGATPSLVEPHSLAAVVASYGWEDATLTHLGTSENVTLRVVAESRTAILRIYRIGHRSKAAIEAEIAWMDALRLDAGISTPEALPSSDGERIHTLATSGDDTYCVAFGALPGKEPEESGLGSRFHHLGILCARMHDHGTTWPRANSLTRPRLDWNTLIGESAVWGPWDRAPGLEPVSRPVLQRVSERIRSRLESYGADDRVYGLIHGDLRLANLLVDGDAVHVIDFDDCCFCWRLYDLATALSLIEHLAVAPQLLDTWLEGYRTIRRLEPDDLAIVADLVMMRRLQVLSWLGSHSHSAAARDIFPWYVPATVTAAEEYLSGKPRLRAGI